MGSPEYKLGKDRCLKFFLLQESLILQALTHFPPTNLGFFQTEKAANSWEGKIKKGIKGMQRSFFSTGWILPFIAE